MAKNILLFQTVSQYDDKRNNDYIEPWVSLTVENGKIDLNKSEMEKLLGTPLTFEITSAGNVSWAGYPYRTIEYKKNDGEWTSVTPASMSPVRISVVAGDVLQFRGNNSAYGDGYGSGDATCFNDFDYPTTAGFIVKGNIMSLVNSTGFTNLTTVSSEAFPNMFRNCTGLMDASQLMLPATTVGNMSYYYMFYGCTSLTSAPELPATTIAQQCYQGMFLNCTSLTTVPSILPATDIRYCIQCYESMFAGCTNLTVAPELPATTLANANGCYGQMFKGCTSLTVAPELPATTLAWCCYGGYAGYSSFSEGGMFEDCTSLTMAPALPATALTSECYPQMFKGCTGLTVAPDLPAQTLTRFCYANMFYGCTNLASVKCLATSFGTSSGPTTNWLAGVSASGTFTKAASMADWSTGANGIPSGWNIINE